MVNTYMLMYVYTCGVSVSAHELEGECIICKYWLLLSQRLASLKPSEFQGKPASGDSGEAKLELLWNWEKLVLQKS